MWTDLITYTPADRAAARRLSALLAWESLLRDPYAGCDCQWQGGK